MNRFTKPYTTNRDVQNLSDSADSVFQSLYPNPLLSGPVIISALTFAAGVDLVIPHKLGRVPKGYIPIGQNASASIYTSPTINGAATAVLILRSSANVVANLMIF